MKMVLTDKAPRRNGLPGAEVEITNNCVRFFEEQGWAVRVDDAARAKQAKPTRDAKNEAGPETPKPEKPKEEPKREEPQATPKPESRPKPKPEPEAKAAPKADDEVDALRAQYEKATGKKADARWKEETLRAKMDEAKDADGSKAKSKSMRAASDGDAKTDNSGSYHRRDMQAED